jgi:hypothetical protein
MPKNLTIDEMLLVASRSKMPGANVLIAEAIGLANVLAVELSNHLEVSGPNAEISYYSQDETGILVSFSPAHPDQPCPEVLRDFDTESDWTDTPRERQRA